MAFIGQNAAMAWAHWNSGNNIADSYNVSSVARYSTGNFVVNLSITLPNSNYCVVGQASSNKNSNGVYLGSPWPKDTTSFYHATHWTNGNAYDLSHNWAAIFGDRN
tara:strand:+ start:70 stop:387 length:318 start_codon:yes stop_codon:yes gene_type:complete